MQHHQPSLEQNTTCKMQNRTEAKTLRLPSILLVQYKWIGICARWAAETWEQPCNFKGQGFNVPHALKLLTLQCVKKCTCGEGEFRTVSSFWLTCDGTWSKSPYLVQSWAQQDELERNDNWLQDSLKKMRIIQPHLQYMFNFTAQNGCKNGLE